jgi:hypothetical protein
MTTNTAPQVTDLAAKTVEAEKAFREDLLRNPER